MLTLVFDWDPAKAASNATKHGVRFEEALTVFRDPLGLSLFDTDGSLGEERWITLGMSSVGNVLLVVHSWIEIDGNRIKIRIISARRPTRNEARQYREGT